ncbi:MAG: hypothetical protein JSR99_00250 [Proteobacteria bacterium]|nr:hypothetical protein [Pseudomonadota bacterium]
MLERVRPGSEPKTEIAGAAYTELTIADVFLFLRTYWPIIAASILACLILGVAYVLVTKPTYTANAQILIEANQQSTPTLANTESLIAMDTPQVESEIALLQSEQIARKVAQLLERRGEASDNTAEEANKTSYSEYSAESYIAWFYNLLFAPLKPDTLDEKEARVRTLMAQIQGNMDVRRVGLSYVLNISYRAGDPKTAARVANAIGDTYVQDKLDLRAQSARQGAAWLEARIEELRRSMNDAALDVQIFKAKRDYRLFDKPNNENRRGDDLPTFGPNPRISPQAVDPSAPETNSKNTSIKPSEMLPEHTTLDELESRAETYKKIYESYLQAYMETVQRQSYPGTNARVITRADPPLRKSGPRRALALAASVVLGTILGFGASLIYMSFDETVRSARQISRMLDVPLLGELTRSTFLSETVLAKFIPYRLRSRRRSQLASSLFVIENRQFPETARQLSATAVALKKVMNSRATHIIGLLGTTPDYNAAAISSNLALLNSNAGWRTLLIEADTANPNLKSFYLADATDGLQDFLAGNSDVANAVVPWPENADLCLLMAKSSNTDWTSEQASRLRSLIEQLSGQYDLILVNLPPANSATRALAAVDNIVVVTKAGQTSISELFDITAALRLAGKQPLGVVISDLM